MVAEVYLIQSNVVQLMSFHQEVRIRPGRSWRLVIMSVEELRSPLKFLMVEAFLKVGERRIDLKMDGSFPWSCIKKPQNPT